MNINLSLSMSLLLLFNPSELSKVQNNFQPLNEIAIVNPQPAQKSYAATAQFWGRVANGVKQPSTITLYPKQENRLLIIMILPQNCGRFFEIDDYKIQKVTYSCPEQEKDESGDYTNWEVEHNSLMKEVKMIAPPAKSNPLYIRNEAFWLIQY